jgi:hypothetical protein
MCHALKSYKVRILTQILKLVYKYRISRSKKAKILFPTKIRFRKIDDPIIHCSSICNQIH